MLKKILLALAMFLSINLLANEPATTTEQCDANYSLCLEKCDNLDESKKEECFDDCDANYSKCLDTVVVE